MDPLTDLLSTLPYASILLDAGAAAGPNLARASGRLHPVVVHFPIALGLVAVGAEWWRSLSRREGLSPLTLPLLWIAAIAALVSTGSGWLVAGYERGNDTGDTLFLHRWLGTVTAFGFVGLAVWCRQLASAATVQSAASLATFRWAALVGGISMSVSGHLGGNLVHGEDYLTEHLFPTTEEVTEEEPVDAPTIELTANERFFVEKVRPIFESHCFECHGAKKQKGGLRMDSKAWLFNGAEEKWAVLPGKAEGSLLVHRVELDRVDPDAMPPEGDGLTADEKSVIRKWIDDGAGYPAVKSATATNEASANAASNATSGAAEPAVPAAARARIDAASRALIARGVLVQPLAADSPLLDVNASRAEPPLGDADAPLLADIAAFVANLNISKNAFTDAGLARIGAMPKLERLRLDGSGVGDQGVRALGSLPLLESINLIGTKVTPALAEWVAAQPALKRAYVWQTALDNPDSMKVLAAGGRIQAIGADIPLAQPKGPPMPEDPKPEEAKPADPKPPT